MKDFISVMSVNPEGDIKIVLPMPPSVNQAYANARKGRIKTQEYKDWVKNADGYFFLSKSKYGPFQDLPSPYLVCYEMQKPDKRRRDCANFEKVLSDYFVSTSIISDDSLIDANIQYWSIKKGSEVTARIWSLDKDFREREDAIHRYGLFHPI